MFMLISFGPALYPFINKQLKSNRLYALIVLEQQVKSFCLDPTRS
jgi:hypothetical protein